MKTWKAIIVDDELLARLELRKLLDPFRQIIIVGEADSVKTASLQAEKLQPDLVFLDINLGTQTGFDLLEVTDSHFHTIFVTAYDEFAIRAFEINALDYLLKPVHPERLKKAISRLGSPFKEKPKVKLNPTDKILVNNQKRSKFISVKSISYVEANGDYTNVNTSEGFKGIAHMTIKKWLERLPDSLFIQIHRSYIVNINRINEIVKDQSGNLKVIVDNQKRRFPISRNFQKQIKEKYRIDNYSDIDY